MTIFLPSNYSAPNDNYMKLIDGDNNFRILSSPIIGWEVWDKVDTNKPIRLRYTEENYEIAMTHAIKNPEIEDKSVKHFWAMVVVDYLDNKIKILNITQKGLQKYLIALVAMKGWGNPVNKYDLIVNKEGKKMRTRYSLSPIPPSPLDPVIENKLAKTKINLEALFYGADPFDGEWKVPTDADYIF